MKPSVSAWGKPNWGKRTYAIFVLCATAVINLPAQTFTTLFSFDGVHGDFPGAALVQATDGNLYGTTSDGTIFRITPTGTLTTLYRFAGAAYSPNGLVQATDGNLYGTTSSGGANEKCATLSGTVGCGTVFKISPVGALTILYSFCSQSGCADGDWPLAGLVQVPNGDLYGTTEYGGAGFDAGTIFKITPSGTLTTLYTFPCIGGTTCAEGEYPASALVQATNGNFYGTTGYGGTPDNAGTVFEIAPSGTLTTLDSILAVPDAGLVQATDANLYGTTAYGGANSHGTVFKMTPSGTLTTLYSFCAQSGCPDGAIPNGLIQASDGNFYGTTNQGGANCAPNGCGTIFKITPNGALTTLYSFCSQSGCADGKYPVGLVQATNGNLYGTTYYGGLGCCGTVFSLSVGLGPGIGPGPFVKTLPTSGLVGASVQILGTNLTGATGVTFNRIAAPFTVVSASLISTTVPAGAATGEVQVAIPSGTLLSNIPFLVQAPAPPFTVALSTAGQVESFAAQAIVSAYGADLATGAPDDTTVTVIDSARVTRNAPLFYVSPAQINFEIPASTATGAASVGIRNQNGTTQTATIQIGNVSPGLFEINGSGLVAAWVLPVISGSQEPLQRVYQILSGAVVPLPINLLGPPTYQVYLEMYGTGIRNASVVTAAVGGLSVPVLYAGPAPGFEGEDQVNIGPLPQSLQGAGSVSIVLTADGQAANTVNVTIQSM